MAAIYGMAELCGVGHRKAPGLGPLSMGKLRFPMGKDEISMHFFQGRMKLFNMLGIYRGEFFCYLPSDFVVANTIGAPAD